MRKENFFLPQSQSAQKSDQKLEKEQSLQSQSSEKKILNSDELANAISDRLTALGLNRHSLTSDEKKKIILDNIDVFMTQTLGESANVNIHPTSLDQEKEEGINQNFPMLDSFFKLTLDNFERDLKIAPRDVVTLVVSFILGALATTPFVESSKEGAERIPPGPLTLFTSYGQQAVNRTLSQPVSIFFNSVLNGDFLNTVTKRFLEWRFHFEYEKNKEALKTISPYSFEYMKHVKNPRNVVNVAGTMLSTIPIVVLLALYNPITALWFQPFEFGSVIPVFSALHFSGAEFLTGLILAPLQKPYKNLKLKRLPPHIREHEIKKQNLEDQIGKLQAAFVATLESSFAYIENSLRIEKRDRLGPLFEWLDKPRNTTNAVMLLMQVCNFAPVKEKDIPVNKVKERAIYITEKIAQFIVAGFSSKWQAQSLIGYTLATATGTVSPRWVGGRIPAYGIGSGAFLSFGGICFKGAIQTGLGFVDLGKQFGKGVYSRLINDPNKEKIPILPFPVGFGPLATATLIGGAIIGYSTGWYSSGPSLELNYRELTELLGQEKGEEVCYWGDNEFGAAAGADIFNGGPLIPLIIKIISAFYIYYQHNKVFRDNIRLLNFIKDQIALIGRMQPKEFIAFLQEVNKFQNAANTVADNANKKDDKKANKPTEVQLDLLNIFFQHQQPENILGTKYENVDMSQTVQNLFDEFQKIEKEGIVLKEEEALKNKKTKSENEDSKSAAAPAKKSWFPSMPSWRPSLPSFWKKEEETPLLNKRDNKHYTENGIEFAEKPKKENIIEFPIDAVDPSTSPNPQNS